MAASGTSAGVGMLYAFVVDVNNLDTCGRFWGQGLGAEVIDLPGRRLLAAGATWSPTVAVATESPRGPRRQEPCAPGHHVTDLQTAVQRVQELGGHKRREVRAYGIAWAVMTDPDGKAFCLVQHTEA